MNNGPSKPTNQEMKKTDPVAYANLANETGKQIVEIDNQMEQQGIAPNSIEGRKFKQEKLATLVTAITVSKHVVKRGNGVAVLPKLPWIAHMRFTEGHEHDDAKNMWESLENKNCLVLIECGEWGLPVRLRGF